MIKTHKITKQRFLLKHDFGNVSTCYFLDENGDRIQDGVNIHGGICYKIGVLLNNNID